MPDSPVAVEAQAFESCQKPSDAGGAKEDVVFVLTRHLEKISEPCDAAEQMTKSVIEARCPAPRRALRQAEGGCALRPARTLGGHRRARGPPRRAESDEPPQRPFPLRSARPPRLRTRHGWGLHAEIGRRREVQVRDRDLEPKERLATGRSRAVRLERGSHGPSARTPARAPCAGTFASVSSFPRRRGFRAAIAAPLSLRLPLPLLRRLCRDPKYIHADAALADRPSEPARVRMCHDILSMYPGIA